MGWFDSLKNFGSSIWGGLKSGFKKVLDIGNTAKDYIARGYNFVKSIPGIGNVVDGLLDKKLPILNVSAKDLANNADNVLGAGNSLAEGDIVGAATKLSNNLRR